MALISASRRTDIPAYFGDWFLSRIRAGFCNARNPFRADQVREVDLSPEAATGLIFWTRRPGPFLPALARLDKLGYPSYVQMTLTGMGPPLETNLPLEGQLCDQMMALSSQIGPERVVWRFDPLLVTNLTPVNEILDRFSRLAEVLAGNCRSIVPTSLVSLYAKSNRRLAKIPGLGVTDLEKEPAAARDLLTKLTIRAKAHNLILAVCCSRIDLTGLDLEPAKCIDEGIFNQIYGLKLNLGRGKGQRPGCNCAPAIDIGAYNTCGHGCAYCYATAGWDSAGLNRERHNPAGAELLPPKAAHKKAGQGEAGQRKTG